MWFFPFPREDDEMFRLITNPMYFPPQPAAPPTAVPSSGGMDKTEASALPLLFLKENEEPNRDRLNRLISTVRSPKYPVFPGDELAVLTSLSKSSNIDLKNAAQAYITKFYPNQA